MPSPGDYPRDLQKVLFQAYRSTGLGDESLGEALAAADQSGSSVGSDDAVSAWRRGMNQAPIGALEVMLDHAGDLAKVILGKLCRRYGLEVVAVRVPKTVGELERSILLVGAGTGDIQRAWADATHPESDGGRDLTVTERHHLADLLDEEIGQLVAIREQVRPRTGTSGLRLPRS